MIQLIDCIAQNNVLTLSPNKKQEEMEDALKKLRKQKSSTPSRWREEAESRLENESWLYYSQSIAKKMRARMHKSRMTQQALADLLDCTQQYVSKVLTGRENLSLETLAKIEKALGLHLIYVEEPQKA